MSQYGIPLIPHSPAVNVDTMTRKLGGVMVLVPHNIGEEFLTLTMFQGVESVQSDYHQTCSPLSSLEENRNLWKIIHSK